MADPSGDEIKLRRYADACAEFAARARELSGAVGSLEKEAFIRLWDRCEEARRLCMVFRDHLNGCSGNLTVRETEILRLVAEGMANKEIAVALGLSVKTVEFHKHQIYERLSVTSTAALVRHAIKIGLIQP